MRGLASHAAPGAVGEGFDSTTLRSADGSTEAEFVPDANMLCCSLSHRGLELLDQGAGVGAYANQGATMGIPLLHPWANRLAGFEYTAAGRHVVLPTDGGGLAVDDNGLPIHGVLPGLMRWEVEQSHPSALAAHMQWASSRLLELFPFRHELILEACVGSGQLEIATTVRPTAEDCVPVSFGYHPYVRLPGVPREAWKVALGAFRCLVLDARKIPTGEREPVERRCLTLEDIDLDDAFEALSVPAEFEAATGDLVLTVEFRSGFPYAQVYAPAASDFVCFEPMTAPANALNSGDGLRVLGPGQQHRATFAISLRDGARNGRIESRGNRA